MLAEEWEAQTPDVWDVLERVRDLDASHAAAGRPWQRRLLQLSRTAPGAPITKRVVLDVDGTAAWTPDFARPQELAERLRPHR